jgi:hypothetical protein
MCSLYKTGALTQNPKKRYYNKTANNFRFVWVIVRGFGKQRARVCGFFLLIRLQIRGFKQYYPFKRVIAALTFGRCYNKGIVS